MDQQNMTNAVLRSGSAEEFGSLHSNSATRLFSVPQLDEACLSPSTNNNSGALGNGSGGAHSSPGCSPMAVHEQATMASALQQQQQAAVAQLEYDYLQARTQLQQCSRGTLLTLVTALLDENPEVLTGRVMLHLEQVALIRAAYSTPTNTAREKASQGAGPTMASLREAAPWTPSSGHHASSTASTPYHPTSPGRKTRGYKGKEEDQKMCSVHHSMRASKHLQLNASTGLFECLPGFHCLVDSGPAHPTPAATEAMYRSGGVSPLAKIVLSTPHSATGAAAAALHGNDLNGPIVTPPAVFSRYVDPARRPSPMGPALAAAANFPDGINPAINTPRMQAAYAMASAQRSPYSTYPSSIQDPRGYTAAVISSGEALAAFPTAVATHTPSQSHSYTPYSASSPMHHSGEGYYSGGSQQLDVSTPPASTAVVEDEEDPKMDMASLVNLLQTMRDMEAE